ncbi:MAG: HAMP domain-containing protein, partial [Spirochaetia bacterium]|nr:HAMP domain-containing protein [Spirochaetia bacterium]
MSNDTELTEKQKKRLDRKKQDIQEKENDIQYGIRYKLITIVSLIVFMVVVAITWIASANQSQSLLKEKKKQGEIMMHALASAIKTRLLDIYAANEKVLNRIHTAPEYREFYLNNGISEMIFEDIDSVTSQPDVLYAYILGKNKVVLGHSDPAIAPYSIFEFQNPIQSYFDAYKSSGMKKPESILTKIKYLKTTSGEKNAKNGINAEKKEKIDAIDFSYILAFKKDPDMEDAIAEVHIGISLESVNKQIFNNQVEMQGIGFASVIIGVLLAIMVATFIARPIRKMIEAMRQVSQGDFSVSVLVASRDEVGLLSRTFNVMLRGMSILVSP